MRRLTVVLALVAVSCTTRPDPKPIRPADERCNSTEPADHFYAENVAYEDRDVLELPEAKPDGFRIGQRMLQRATSDLARTTGTMSFLVMQSGKLIWERYFNGSAATHANNIHSASKAILSLALGRAIETEKLSLDDDIRDHLPDELIPAEAPKLSVRDLATMSGGLAWTENETEQRFDQDRSYVRQILELKQTEAPGRAFAYNTGLTHLLGAVITEATGTPLCEYVHREVLQPLGVTIDHWHTDPDGYNAGGHSVFMTARELARIGQYVLDETDDRLDGGPPGSWLRTALARRWQLGCRAPSESFGYGHLWWRSNINDVKLWKAEGFGGQSMYIVPATQTVVVITTDTHTQHEPIDHTALLTSFVLNIPGGGGCDGFDLQRSNIDGSDVVQLTHKAAMDLWGAISPDGKRIAFQSTRDGNWDIHVTNRDPLTDLEGAGPTRLTVRNAPDTFPAWSPDGGRIVFSRGGAGAGIFTMNTAGRDVRRVTEGSDLTPAWSPDGDRIVFGRTGAKPGAPETLMVVAADGGEAGPVGDLRGAAPSWSPDGDRITFFRDDTVYMANADGTAMRRVADGRHPRFLPDGSLVFAALGGRQDTWRIVRWDGDDIRTVVDTHEDDLVPMPSRDGTWLTFSSAPKSARGGSGAVE